MRKVDTKEKYEKLQERRGVQRKRRHARDYMQAVFDRQGRRRITDGMKPNHKARAVNISDCFTKPTPKVSNEDSTPAEEVE